jgi:hypothetical protein
VTGKLRRYRTGFETSGEEPDEPPGPFRGAGWTAELVPENRECDRIVGGKDIVLHAQGWSAAQRALDLINGCRQLVNGNPDVFGPLHPVVSNDDEPEWMDDAERASLPERLMSQSWLPTACAVAAKASRRRRWMYAVAKYKFSIELYGVHHMDMQPSYHLFHRVSAHPDDHVLFSHAILSAFGAIEDMGLNVPAGPGRPSRIGGVWNPDVLADLEDRLRRQGIDPAEELLWTVRGPARRIERRRPLPAGTSPSWAGGPVRDRKVAVVDAIAYSDFLRDCVAAHGAKPLTRSLSPYDVVNVQHVARFLLLASLGFRVWLPRRP